MFTFTRSHNSSLKTDNQWVQLSLLLPLLGIFIGDYYLLEINKLDLEILGCFDKMSTIVF